MKKIFWWIIGFFSLIIVLYVYLLFFFIGYGTYYVFEVTEGCDLINNNSRIIFILPDNFLFTNKYFENNSQLIKVKIEINYTDELLDNVKIKEGYPRFGLKEMTLREYAEAHNFNESSYESFSRKLGGCSSRVFLNETIITPQNVSVNRIREPNHLELYKLNEIYSMD